MNIASFFLGAFCASTFAVQLAQAAGPGDTSVIEVVTFKLKPGVTDAQFTPIDKNVETQHVSKQPGFISRESAAGVNGERLAIVHWRSLKDAEASMATFEKAPAAVDFMANIDASTMSMKRYKSDTDSALTLRALVTGAKRGAGRRGSASLRRACTARRRLPQEVVRSIFALTRSRTRQRPT